MSNAASASALSTAPHTSSTTVPASPSTAPASPSPAPASPSPAPSEPVAEVTTTTEPASASSTGAPASKQVRKFTIDVTWEELLQVRYRVSPVIGPADFQSTEITATTKIVDVLPFPEGIDRDYMRCGNCGKQHDPSLCEGPYTPEGLLVVCGLCPERHLPETYVYFTPHRFVRYCFEDADRAKIVADPSPEYTKERPICGPSATIRSKQGMPMTITRASMSFNEAQKLILNQAPENQRPKTAKDCIPDSLLRRRRWEDEPPMIPPAAVQDLTVPPAATPLQTATSTTATQTSAKPVVDKAERLRAFANRGVGELKRKRGRPTKAELKAREPTRQSARLMRDARNQAPGRSALGGSGDGEEEENNSDADEDEYREVPRHVESLRKTKKRLTPKHLQPSDKEFPQPRACRQMSQCHVQSMLTRICSAREGEEIEVEWTEDDNRDLDFKVGSQAWLEFWKMMLHIFQATPSDLFTWGLELDRDENEQTVKWICEILPHPLPVGPIPDDYESQITEILEQCDGPRASWDAKKNTRLAALATKGWETRLPAQGTDASIMLESLRKILKSNDRAPPTAADDLQRFVLRKSDVSSVRTVLNDLAETGKLAAQHTHSHYMGYMARFRQDFDSLSPSDALTMGRWDKMCTMAKRLDLARGEPDIPEHERRHQSAYWMSKKWNDLRFRNMMFSYGKGHEGVRRQVVKRRPGRPWKNEPRRQATDGSAASRQESQQSHRTHQSHEGHDAEEMEEDHEPQQQSDESDDRHVSKQG
ncbi:hypothetical protein F4778DRAFT_785408 [Xylariomycetidae sp. FL2044]|nr:hypothetical protein F4778DRAFT_785408 [Xylariomycetidae sp. FL2044]